MQTERLSAYEAAPAAMRAVQQVEAYIQQCDLEESLIELVKMRAPLRSTAAPIASGLEPVGHDDDPGQRTVFQGRLEACRASRIIIQARDGARPLLDV
jgi:hypothetical protein